MKKTAPRKLNLYRETLCTLADRQMPGIAGGLRSEITDDAFTCSRYCNIGQ